MSLKTALNFQAKKYLPAKADIFLQKGEPLIHDKFTEPILKKFVWNGIMKTNNKWLLFILTRHSHLSVKEHNFLRK